MIEVGIGLRQRNHCYFYSLCIFLNRGKGGKSAHIVSVKTWLTFLRFRMVTFLRLEIVLGWGLGKVLGFIAGAVVGAQASIANDAPVRYWILT